MSSPSNRNTFPCLASQRRSALSAMASKTGCTSVCDWLITRRISAVAVCRSSDSVRSRLRDSSSLNSRTFSMANRLGVRPLGVARPWEGRPHGGILGPAAERGCGMLDLIPNDAGQHPLVRPQQPDGSAHNRVEYWLHIRLRAADHTQDVAGGGLLVERGGELAVAELQLREQPHVLDGD